MKERFKLNLIYITDDTFTCRDIKEIRDFCSKYKKYINIKYKCYVDARTITDEKVKELVNSGCFQISLGIQGSERVNKEVYHRYIDYKNILRAAEI